MNELTAASLTAISIFLTLTSLLGSFFYVPLSNWVRELIALNTKWQLNKGADTDTTRPLQRECRHTLPALNNIVPGMMSVAISLFIATVSTLAFLILRPYLWGVSLAVYLFAAFVAFLLIYITFTLFLLIRGYGIARRLQIEIDEKFGSRA
jgi:hypothetical protein